ncbi:DUF2808 domain-containing protein [Oscillatoria acuminata]|uniref:DUF2808 domain-containing protein n=1 Tax=Oscillatoria acuminata PCC 6304 TaxID=56110 RepID=K9THH7_9CYAN|nr:DUF2808 domain-containing protein [Oscillatoria acuminata]AFY81601.1 Protein of unknown function (DUF2808) [Oscillatoria acuminata PCC 6304]
MLSPDSAMRRVFLGIAVTGLLITAMPTPPSWAFRCSGLTVFGGVRRDRELKYCVQNGRENSWDRYWLKIPKEKVNLAISELRINYPENYRGEFNEDRIEVTVNGNKIDLDDAFWDRDNRFIQIYPTEAIPANTDIEIVLNNVRNPNFGGMFNFNALVVTRGGPPIPEYIGTWVLAIN